MKQIRTALDKLVDAGLIVKGNFSKDRFKRENWYALGDTKCPNGQMEGAEQADDTFAPEGSLSAQKGECIKDKYKPDSKPNSNGVSADEVVGSDLDEVWEAYPKDRPRDWKACQLLVKDALKQVSLADLVAAAREYNAESADTPRSKVSFMDNWLRQEKWQRHVDDRHRLLASIEAKVGERTTSPAVALRMISDDDSEKIAAWDRQLAQWDLPPFKEFALKGIEGGREGWLWPLQWVPSDPAQLSLVEKYASRLHESHLKLKA